MTLLIVFFSPHTGVKGRVDNLLRPPQLRVHIRDLVLLIRGDKLLSLFQTRGRNEQRPVPLH